MDQERLDARNLPVVENGLYQNLARGGLARMLEVLASS